MIHVKLKNKIHKIKNEMSELTLFEFEDIRLMLDREKEYPINNICEALKICGATEEFLDDIYADQLKQLFMYLYTSKIKTTYKKSKTIKKRKFHAFETDNFEGLTAKTIRIIERINGELGETKPTTWLIMAVLMKEQGKDKSFDHYNREHILEKMEFFKLNMDVAYAMPYVMEYESEILNIFRASIERNI